jgi:hypothetical protein
MESEELLAGVSVSAAGFSVKSAYNLLQELLQCL